MPKAPVAQYSGRRTEYSRERPETGLAFCQKKSKAARWTSVSAASREGVVVGRVSARAVVANRKQARQAEKNSAVRDFWFIRPLYRMSSAAALAAPRSAVPAIRNSATIVFRFNRPLISEQCEKQCSASAVQPDPPRKERSLQHAHL